MIKINGSSGGGQMLRTALSLSVVQQQDFCIENIRGNRSNPGLRRQHLEAVKAAKRISDAEVEGAEIGSDELVFKPRNLDSSSFSSNIGTAGSITLLYDAVLPITSQFNNAFRLTAKGGTDVKWSPPFSYLKQVKLPLLREFGVKAETELQKSGYYPKGGGETQLITEEHSLQPINLTERGRIQRFEIHSKASKELENQNVADRQADEAERMLKNSHISTSVDKNVRYEKTASPGSSILVKAVYENSVTGFSSLGEKNKRSEEVAKEAVQDFKKFHSTEASVDEHMADQLMVSMAIIGGEITVPEITSHVETNITVLEKFGCECKVRQEAESALIYVNP